jgi:hypothetical protein
LARGSHLLGTKAASEVVSEVKREDEARWARLGQGELYGRPKQSEKL